MPGPQRLEIAGEPRLTERVREAARRGALSHAVILSGPGDLAEAARFVAAAMECTGDEPPCGVCGPCRKVLRGVHPDVVTVSDPEHKNISLDVLRRTLGDTYVLPNEGRRKIYIFPDCGLLDPKAQNMLLKVVEEGPSHAAFLFCAPNSAALLPTIRSRAVEWKLAAPDQGPAAGEAAGDDGKALRLVELLCGGPAADLAAFCVDLENAKPEREALGALLSRARDFAAAGLAAAYGADKGAAAAALARKFSRRRLSACADALGEAARGCQYNINIGQLLGALGVWGA